MINRASYVLMVGTSLRTKGGVASVLQVYRAAELLDGTLVRYLETHIDGNYLEKAILFAYSLSRLTYILVFDRPAILHIHMASGGSFWRKSIVMALGWLFRVPYIIHLHGGEFHLFYGERCSPAIKRWVRRCFASAAAVIVLGDRWRDWVTRNCPSSRVQVIYNPINIMPNSEADRTGPPKILFLGRLGHAKGTYDLLEAFALINSAFPSSRLLLGGDGDIEHVKKRVAELGLTEKVECLGWVSGDAKASAFACATAFALPSYNEGLPMSVLEAMAHGLPIVTTPVGSIPEAIEDGVTGLLVPPGDVARLATALHSVLNDFSLRRRLGTSARAAVEKRYSSQAIVSQIRALHATVMEKSVPPRGVVPPVNRDKRRDRQTMGR